MTDTCLLCREPIAPGEQTHPLNDGLDAGHTECLLRSVKAMGDDIDCIRDVRGLVAEVFAIGAARGYKNALADMQGWISEATRQRSGEVPPGDDR